MFLSSLQSRVILLPRLSKQAIVAACDLCMSFIAMWAAFALRLETSHWPHGGQWLVYLLAPILALPIFARFGMYRAIFRYTGLSVMSSIAKAILLYGALLFLILIFWAPVNVPRSVGLLQPLLFLILVGGSRAFARFWLSGGGIEHGKLRVRLLIYGAGDVGAQIASVLRERKEFELIGFLDDDAQLWGKTINNLKVYSADKVTHLISRYGVTDVLLAFPGLERSERNRILRYLSQFHLHVRSLPDLADLAQGKVAVSDIRELNLADLLGRDPVSPDLHLIRKNISDNVVLVTGAGGSIGSELCRQILVMAPSKLLLLEHSEYALYVVHNELDNRLKEMGLSTELVPLLCSVRDESRLEQIFSGWRPSVVYHAAAYKHVPLVEHNPAEGIRNNVFGTYKLTRVARKYAVEHFVLISTDKAVRPTNVMGASKRLAEMILQALAAEQVAKNGEKSNGAPCFTMVRFGNVLGSSGSVVPLFRQQIRDGGPVTLTDKNVTRYFMSIAEAAQLVIQAGAMAESGDVFLLDMGEPVKIFDLAYRMVELSGLSVRDETNPNGDIEIEITGLRPGEKLYEELLIGDNPQLTSHPLIMKAREDFLAMDQLEPELDMLKLAIDANNVEQIRELLVKLVHGYRPSDGQMDLVHRELVGENSRDCVDDGEIARCPAT